MRKSLLAAVMAGLPLSGMARQYDSGWRITTAEDLPDPALSGAGVQVNNLVITQSDQPRGKPLANYAFSASAVKCTAGRRSLRIKLVGLKGDRMPSIAINVSDEQPNRMQADQHRFVAFPAEVAETGTYLLRVLIP